MVLLQYHPARNYLSFLLNEHRLAITNHLSKRVKRVTFLSYPRIRKGARRYVHETSRARLSGPTLLLFEDLLRRNEFPKHLSVKYGSINNRCFEIMNDPQLQKSIEISALRGLTDREIAELVSEKYPLRNKYSEVEIRHYNHFFWNVSKGSGSDIIEQNQLLAYLSKDRRYQQFYADYIDILTGKLSPFVETIKYGSDKEIFENLRSEILKGLANSLEKKNRAVEMGNTAEANIYSELSLRDTQLLRNLGIKPTKKALRDLVKVVSKKPELNN